MTEQVNCPYCGHDRIITTEDATCRCGAELCQTQTLRARIRSLEAQITALGLAHIKAVSELCRRERLRNVRQGRGQTSPVFWQGVVGKPDWASRPKTRIMHSIDMTDFT